MGFWKKGKTSLYNSEYRQQAQRRYPLVEHNGHRAENRPAFFIPLVLTDWKVLKYKTINWTIDEDEQKSKPCKYKISLNTFKNLSKNELDNLSDTAREFFILYSLSGKKVNFVILETCGW